MAAGRKTGGRKAGTPNKIKAPTVVATAKMAVRLRKMYEDAEQALKTSEKMPLEVMLDFMRDESNPPSFNARVPLVRRRAHREASCRHHHHLGTLRAFLEAILGLEAPLSVTWRGLRGA
jgi:hypothetical protein